MTTDPTPDTWFDRTVCPAPCGSMHTRCTACGTAVDGCSTDPTPETARSVRDQLIDALDFSYCQGLGYETPEGLVAAFEASLPAVPSVVSGRALHDRVTEALREARRPGLGGMTEAEAVAHMAAAVVGVLAADNRADDAPAATCSAQYHGPGEEKARLCIRAAQHTGTAHTDEQGFHWSDTVAMYPLDNGTFRTGINLRAELRRLAAETQQTQTETPWATDGARIGRTLIWTWADIGKGEYGKGYRAAQEEARALLTGQRTPAVPVEAAADGGTIHDERVAYIAGVEGAVDGEEA